MRLFGLILMLIASSALGCSEEAQSPETTPPPSSVDEPNDPAPSSDVPGTGPDAPSP